MNIGSIVITGGAGFIGSHLCEEIYNNFPKSKIIILNKLTYALKKKYKVNDSHLAYNVMKIIFQINDKKTGGN